MIRQDSVTTDKKFRKIIANHIVDRSFKNIDYYIDRTKREWEYFWIIKDGFNADNFETIKTTMLNEYNDHDGKLALEQFTEAIEKYMFSKDNILTVTDFLKEWGYISSKHNDDMNFYFMDFIYTIRGEVYNYYIDEENQTLIISLMQYVTDGNPHRKRYFLKIKFDSLPENIDELKQYSVIQITGHPYIISRLYNNMEYYSAYSDRVIIDGESFTLIANEPKIIKEWKNEISILDIKKQNFNGFSPSKRIYLIASLDGDGYSDFMEIINKDFDFEIINPRMKYTLSIENIVNEIIRINQESKDGYICILRGGGNPYDLIQFSSPKICEAIAKSSLPVVMGVGHSKDKNRLLCNDFAYKACITPSEAARFFIDLYNKWNQS